MPYMDSGAGQDRWGWLLGEGESRGIALIFLCAGVFMILIAFAAMLTKTYRTLVRSYQQAAPAVPEVPEVPEVPGAVTASPKIEE